MHDHRFVKALLYILTKHDTTEKDNVVSDEVMMFIRSMLFFPLANSIQPTHHMHVCIHFRFFSVLLTIRADGDGDRVDHLDEYQNKFIEEMKKKNGLN